MADVAAFWRRFVGDLGVIPDGEGAPLCVVRTTPLKVRAFGGVDEPLWDGRPGADVPR